MNITIREKSSMCQCWSNCSTKEMTNFVSRKHLLVLLFRKYPPHIDEKCQPITMGEGGRGGGGKERLGVKAFFTPHTWILLEQMMRYV